MQELKQTQKIVALPECQCNEFNEQQPSVATWSGASMANGVSLSNLTPQE